MKNSILGSISNACGHGNSYFQQLKTRTVIPVKRGKDKLWYIHTMEYYSAKKLLITHYGGNSKTLLSKTMFLFRWWFHRCIHSSESMAMHFIVTQNKVLLAFVGQPGGVQQASGKNQNSEKWHSDYYYYYLPSMLFLQHGVHSTVSLLRSHMMKIGYGNKVICLETLIIHNLYFQISAIPFK